MDKHTSNEDLSRQAYDFATMHPSHPLSENLKAKARLLGLSDADGSIRIELILLLAKASGTS